MKGDRRRDWGIAVVAVVILIVIVVVVRRGDDSDGGGPAAEATCQVAPSSVVGKIAGGLEDGLSLRRAYYAPASRGPEWYFVAGDLEGPGLEGNDEIATFATSDLGGGGLTFAVDAVANEFTDWGDGRSTDAGFSASDAGVRVARDCVA